MITMWHQETDTQDAPRRLYEGEPGLLLVAEAAARKFEEIRSRNVDVLEPDLVGALDFFGEELATAQRLRAEIERQAVAQNESDHRAEAWLGFVVVAVMPLVEVWRRHEPELAITQGAGQFAVAHIEQIIRNRDEFRTGDGAAPEI
jgi:hypothetical protein